MSGDNETYSVDVPSKTPELYVVKLPNTIAELVTNAQKRDVVGTLTIENNHLSFSVKPEFIKKMNKDPDSFPKEVSFGDEIQGTKPIRVCQHKNKKFTIYQPLYRIRMGTVVQSLDYGKYLINATKQQYRMVL